MKGRMRPPQCALCDQHFDPFGDAGARLVSFARDSADAAWYRRAEQPGFVGHPPHQDWFCDVHADAAAALAHETRRGAMIELRRLASLSRAGTT